MKPEKMKSRKKEQHRIRRLAVIGLLLWMIGLTYAADNSWMKNVPESDRARTNPYAGQADAIAAGSRLFSDHCAKCHGPDALGRRKRPGLRSDEVQNAADGEIFWILRNGDLRRGMPSWSSLPEASRWQIIAYVKNLGKKNDKKE
jgi:mono/diheme cytochrome c family protein